MVENTKRRFEINQGSHCQKENTKRGYANKEEFSLAPLRLSPQAMIEPVGVEMRPEEEKNIFPMNFPLTHLILLFTPQSYIRLVWHLYCMSHQLNV